MDRITIPFRELHELLVEAGIPKYNVRFALRFWHRLGRCIWLEKHYTLPVVIDVEEASRIFGHVICSGDRRALRELGLTFLSEIQGFQPYATRKTGAL